MGNQVVDVVNGRSLGKILVVDDARLIRVILRGILTTGGYEVAEADGGAKALEMLSKGGYDAVITDLKMPDLDGFGVLAGVKRVAPSVEVIILTGTHAKDMRCAVRALRLGAHDYLSKPPSGPDAVLLTVAHAVEKKRLKDANARLVTELENLSRRDSLTGMLNRRCLDEILPQEVSRARRHGHGLGVVMLDIDYFKNVNDTYGHPGGDRVLSSFARVVASLLREGDTLFRYGGEEFLVLLPHVDAGGTLRVGERIVAAIASTPIDCGGTLINITTSAGAAWLGKARIDAAGLIQEADAALYEAKNNGRNRVAGARSSLSLVASRE